MIEDKMREALKRLLDLLDLGYQAQPHEVDAAKTKVREILSVLAGGKDD